MINSISVFLIDNVQPDRSDPFIDDIVTSLFQWSVSSPSFLNEVFSFSKNDLINNSSNWSNVLGTVPTVIIIDDATNIALGQINNPVSTTEIVNEVDRISKLTYNNTLGEYVNNVGLPQPQLLFRDPNTGIVEVFKNSILSTIPTNLFLLKAIAFGIGAVTSKGTIKKATCTAVSVACLYQYNKRK